MPGREKYPTVIVRTPYVDDKSEMTEDAIGELAMTTYDAWMEKGYTVVLQHCRGRGKSSGEFISFRFEREDGLALRRWIREQPFYNGEIYLMGSSYPASVHFATVPFEPDVKGAVLRVQDCERYNRNYRNGFLKIGLGGNWYISNYKKKKTLKRDYTVDDFNMLPLSGMTKKVFGESAEDFDEVLKHPDRNDIFWDTQNGWGNTKDAIKNANIPILLATGYYDIYTGGIFDMWNNLDEGTKSKSALLVRPYDHGDNESKQPIAFERGSSTREFGRYNLRWLEYIRGKESAPFETGKVTYYKTFADEWHTDDFDQPEKRDVLYFGGWRKDLRLRSR